MAYARGIEICNALGLDPKNIETISIIAKKHSIEVVVRFISLDHQAVVDVAGVLKKYVLVEQTDKSEF